MKILGVDPGLAALGYGIVDYNAGRLSLCALGNLRTKRIAGLRVGQDLALRVDELASAFERVLDLYGLDSAAVEEFRFYGKSVTSSMQVSNVVGMVREALRARCIPVAEYSAQTIKKAVTGYPNADKQQVQKMVKIQLTMNVLPRPTHAADALAAAITHAHRLPLLRRTVVNQ